MKDDGPKMTVGEYYQREKKYTIGYIRLPLLKIGTKGSMVPIEVSILFVVHTLLLLYFT